MQHAEALFGFALVVGFCGMLALAVGIGVMVVFFHEINRTWPSMLRTSEESMRKFAESVSQTTASLNNAVQMARSLEHEQRAMPVFRRAVGEDAVKDIRDTPDEWAPDWMGAI
jgi:hypothetical protein